MKVPCDSDLSFYRLFTGTERSVETKSERDLVSHVIFFLFSSLMISPPKHTIASLARGTIDQLKKCSVMSSSIAICDTLVSPA